MSFVTELPVYDGKGQGGVSPKQQAPDAKLFDLSQYKERYKDFKPSFMGARQDVALSQLKVTFGGFQPTPMQGEGQHSTEFVDEINGRLADYYAAKRLAAQVEQARASEPRCIEIDDCTWTYVLLDGSEVRIERCETSALDVFIPSSIEGCDVVALAPDALSNLSSATQIVCPDTIVSIGGCAFRGCSKLKRLVLPALVDCFESSWFRHCRNVEELVLPGGLETIKADIFDNSTLKRLVVGAATCDVAAGAFAKSKLESVEVDSRNAFLASDGKALYTKDGSWMIALCIPCASYEVAFGTQGLAKRCMSGFGCLQEVALPDSIVYIADFAFYNTSIERFDAPSSLVQISCKAFFRASKLADVVFNDGLRVIQDSAFADTALACAHLPATLYHLEANAFAHTDVVMSGSDATVCIPKDAEYLHIDSCGLLYRTENDGVHLIGLLDPRQTDAVIASQTRFVDDEALAKHAAVRRVTLPEGLERIGKAAFKGCTALYQMHIPSTVRVIGDEAMLDTNLVSINLPASLVSLGANALVSYYAHHGEGQPSIRDVEVAPELSQRYFYEGSLLCERKERGVEVMLCTGTCKSVHIPLEVRTIAEYAFNGINTIEELSLSNNIFSIGVRGLSIESYVKHIHIDLIEPIEGHESFDLYYPDTPRSRKQLALAFTTMSECDVEMLFRYYDTVVCNAMGFGKDAGGLKLHEQVRRMLERLEDPIYMTSSHRDTLTRFLLNNVVDVCEALARADDRASIDRLIDLGYITEDNLTECIDRVGVVQDAAMTGYLLEVKRRRFGGVTMDFSL